MIKSKGWGVHKSTQLEMTAKESTERSLLAYVRVPQTMN